MKELQKQLAEARQADIVAQKTKQIEELEAEMKRQKRHLEKQRMNENESLRKDMDDCIKFIVHKLPSDWEDHLGAIPPPAGGSTGYEVPLRLKEKLYAVSL